MLKRMMSLVTAGVFGFLAMSGTSLADAWSSEEKESQIKRANASIAAFKEADPSMSEKFFGKAHGFVIYPSITKGGFIVGGASGKGVVFKGGKPIGGSRLTQGTFGAQIGGQSYSQVIFFENEAALERFKTGKLEFAAQASAVAASAGASVDVDYRNGVAVFTMAQGGLMAEASIGGQNFSFEPF